MAHIVNKNVNIIKLNENTVSNSMNSLFESRVGQIFRDSLVTAREQATYTDNIMIEHLSHYKVALKEDDNDIFNKRNASRIAERQKIIDKVDKQPQFKKMLTIFNDSMNKLTNLEFDHIFILYDKDNISNELTINVDMDEKVYSITTPALIVVEVTLEGDKEQFRDKTLQIYKQLYVAIERSEEITKKFLIGQKLVKYIENESLKVFPILVSNGVVKNQYSDFYSTLDIQNLEYFTKFGFSILMQKREKYIKWTKPHNEIHQAYKKIGSIDLDHMQNIFSQELVFQRFTNLDSKNEEIVKNQGEQNLKFEMFVKNQEQFNTELKADQVKLNAKYEEMSGQLKTINDKLDRILPAEHNV